MWTLFLDFPRLCLSIRRDKCMAEEGSYVCCFSPSSLRVLPFPVSPFHGLSKKLISLFCDCKTVWATVSCLLMASIYLYFMYSVNNGPYTPTLQHKKLSAALEFQPFSPTSLMKSFSWNKRLRGGIIETLLPSTCLPSPLDRLVGGHNMSHHAWGGSLGNLKAGNKHYTSFSTKLPPPTQTFESRCC